MQCVCVCGGWEVITIRLALMAQQTTATMMMRIREKKVEKFLLRIFILLTCCGVFDYRRRS